MINLCCVITEELNEKENLIKEVKVVEKRPTGKIVGIVRRKWRQYCGILQANPMVGVGIFFLLMLFLSPPID